MTESPIILHTSLNSLSLAKTVSKALIKNKLAACVSIHPNSYSCYRWDNKIELETETMMEIKSIRSKIKAIETYLQEHSTYDCPQIIVSDIPYMSDPYKRWFMEQFDL